jgi:hypothetical protein
VTGTDKSSALGSACRDELDAEAGRATIFIDDTVRQCVCDCNQYRMFSYNRSPAKPLLRPARPTCGLEVSHPRFQMRMSGCPRQHRAGYAEVIVLSLRTGIDRSAFPILCLQICELLKGAAHHRCVGKSHLIGL